MRDGAILRGAGLITDHRTFAHTSKRSTIPGRSGFWYQLVDGALAGYWVAESSEVFLTPAATPTPTPAATALTPRLRCWPSVARSVGFPA